MIDDPLVVTLALPDDVQQCLDELRRRWFPAGRTHVGAHITLFHAVPASIEDELLAQLGRVAEKELATLRFSRIVSLGKGAAIAIESPGLVRQHQVLQDALLRYLTRQDRQPLRPHVTVQNKVDVQTARATVATLTATFTPFDATSEGFDVWRYVGGPWKHLTFIDATTTQPNADGTTAH